jgi:hypothetical protein
MIQFKHDWFGIINKILRRFPPSHVFRFQVTEGAY